jgi:hypothetical protein
MKKQIFIIGIAMLGLLASCEKDEQTSPQPPSSKEILTTGEWLVESIESRTYLNDSLVDVHTEAVGAIARFYDANYVVARIPGEPADTAGYRLQGNSIWIDDIRNDIITLNNEELIFSFMELNQSPKGAWKTENITNLSRY